jgi:hypothetical protein
MSLMWDAQVAAVTAWKANAGVRALLGNPARIYDGAAPTGAVKPYAVVGLVTEVPSNVIAKRGWSTTFTVHVFSAYAGKKEADAVIKALDTAVRSELTLSDHQAARFRPEFGEVLEEDDGVRHGVRRYRITARET